MTTGASQPNRGPRDPDGDGEGRFDGRNRGPETLLAQLTDTGSSGYVLGLGSGEAEALDAAVLDQLADLPTDGDIHEVDLRRSRRATECSRSSTDAGVEVTGLPTRQVDDAVTSLIGVEALLIALGAVLAAGRRRSCSYAASCGRCARWPRPRTRWPGCRWPRATST